MERAASFAFGRILVPALAALGASAACSSDHREETARGALEAPLAPQAKVISAPQPHLAAPAPRIPDVASLDGDGDRVADRFPEVGAGRVGVEAIFDQPIGQAELDAFTAAGGVVRHVFRAISYGFTGTLPRSRAVARAAARALGPHLLLLEADRLAHLHLDQATATGRARSVWGSGFAGSQTGFSGTGVTIAFIDTGIDGTHPDLAGRMNGWKDYSADADAEPVDRRGHGSHVAGIALGSGAAFGLGPGLLRYTDQDDLGTIGADLFQGHPIHVAVGSPFTMTSTATWLGGGSAELDVLSEADGAIGSYSIVAGPATGASPLSHVFNVPAQAGAHFSTGLLQNAGKSIGVYDIATAVTGYPAVGDGAPAFRGVASAAEWFGAKVFLSKGDASTSVIAEAMDDIVAERVIRGIKVVNLSFTVGSGDTDLTQRAKANTMVDHGLVVVIAAGNTGADVGIGDPGRAGSVITAGATNDDNALTAYSAKGFTTAGTDEDQKPDILAPGGSLRTSQILSVDSNTADGPAGELPDAVPNDYTSIMGTSMAAPFVSGSAALLIEALARNGTTWSYDSSASPLFVKMLLLASATETNQPREDDSGNPVLGRSASPKDVFEGYGIINPDAAIEAAILPLGDFTVTTAGGPSDRRAWGRRVAIDAGKTLRVVLEALATAPPGTADFDLYLYDATPSPKGDPVLLAASDAPASGAPEKLVYSPTAATTGYLLVKRITGGGSADVTARTFTCGDGLLEPGEDCDDGNKTGAPGDCCSSTCQFESDGTSCDDGSVCTKADTCHAGKCSGDVAISCPGIPSDACHVGVCEPTSGACGIGQRPNGSPCAGGTCIDGLCALAHPGQSSGLAGDLALIPDSAGFSVGGGGCTCEDAPGSSPRPRSPAPEGGWALAVGAVGVTLLRRRAPTVDRGSRRQGVRFSRGEIVDHHGDRGSAPQVVLRG